QASALDVIRTAPPAACAAPGQAAQQGEVLDVLVQIGRLRRLDAPRNIPKSRVVHDPPKGRASKSALANPGVTVHPGTQLRLRVVEMEGKHLIEPDQPVHL